MKATWHSYIGQTYGRLLVLDAWPDGRYARARCRCECGAETVVHIQSLRTGATTSCGCFRREHSTRAKTTHGLSHTAEYRTWHAIRKRCYCASDPKYANYGGRGIYVCQRWIGSFENFFADMGQRPSSKHSIDRIDNDGPYAPENCRWATYREQAINRTNNKLLTHEGITLPVCEWARRNG